MLLVYFILQIPLIGIALLFGSEMIILIVNILLLLIFLIPFIRFRVFSKPLYNHLIKYFPKISKTEQESLMAGEPWLGIECFKINPDWNKIFNYKSSRLTDNEEYFLDQVVGELCKLSNDWEIDQNSNIERQLINYIKTHKLWGIIVPKKYGGLEFSPLAQSLIVSKIASKSVNISIVVMVPNSLGPAELLIKYGTETQKLNYLPKLATGDEIPCFGLTSTVAGSDASSIIDNGIVCHGYYKGAKILGIKLNWSKRYITLAPIATLMSIAIKLYDPNKLLSSEEEPGITLCLIPTNHKGVVIGDRHYPMNLKFPNGTIEGKDVFIPIDWLIGGQNYIGRGWSMLMECLSIGRSLSLPALSKGMSQKCLLTVSAYSMIREQFNLPVAAFEGVQEKLARIAGFTYLIDAVNTVTVDALNLSKHPSVESAIAKYHLTEFGRKIINDTMDVFGGKSIQFGPNNFIGYCYQALPISITVEGSNILTRNLIIFGQGIMMFHPLMLEKFQCSTQATKENIVKFEKNMIKHLYRICALLYKNIYYNIMKIFFRFMRKSSQSKFLLNYYSNSLSILSEFILVYFGKRFKTKESISGNLGDILSYIYINYAIERYNKDNHLLESESLFNWTKGYLNYKILESFNNVFILIPSRFLSKLVKSFIFPFGISSRRHYLVHNKNVVNSISSNTKIREHLTKVCYRGNDTCAINVIEESFAMLPELLPIYKKLSNNGIARSQVRTLKQISALKKIGILADIISHQELKALENYTALMNEAIKVDQF